MEIKHDGRGQNEGHASVSAIHFPVDHNALEKYLVQDTAHAAPD